MVIPILTTTHEMHDFEIIQFEYARWETSVILDWVTVGRKK